MYDQFAERFQEPLDARLARLTQKGRRGGGRTQGQRERLKGFQEDCEELQSTLGSAVVAEDKSPKETFVCPTAHLGLQLVLDLVRGGWRLPKRVTPEAATASTFSLVSRGIPPVMIPSRETGWSSRAARVVVCLRHADVWGRATPPFPHDDDLRVLLHRALLPLSTIFHRLI